MFFKDPAKNLQKMKLLLLAYALLYTDVRISFRITGGGGSMMLQGTMKEKLSQVFGSSKISALTEGEKELGGWNWRFVIPTFTGKSTDTKVSWDYSLFAINGIPLNPSLSVTRKIVTHVNKLLSRLGNIATAAWVIAITNVDVNSYDRTVETSKDDLLFRDLDELLYRIESFIASVFPCVEVTSDTTLVDVSDDDIAEETTLVLENSPVESNKDCARKEQDTTRIESTPEMPVSAFTQTFSTHQPQSVSLAELKNQLRQNYLKNSESASETPFQTNTLRNTRVAATSKKVPPNQSTLRFHVFPETPETRRQARGSFTRPKSPVSRPKRQASPVFSRNAMAAGPSKPTVLDQFLSSAKRPTPSTKPAASPAPSSITFGAFARSSATGIPTNREDIQVVVDLTSYSFQTTESNTPPKLAEFFCKVLGYKSALQSEGWILCHE